MREPPADPARSENLRMHGNSMRENREIPRLPAGVMVGRAVAGKSDGRKPDMHERGKSDGPVVPAKPPNKAVRRGGGGGGGKGTGRGEHGQRTRPGRRAGTVRRGAGSCARGGSEGTRRRGSPRCCTT